MTYLLNDYMKIIPSKTHGILDYLTVAFLLVSPSLFKMEGSLSTVTYSLGIAQLLLTVFTNYERGLMKVIPFRIHGLIEIIAALVLAGFAFWFYNDGNTFGFYYYIVLAIVYVTVFILTDFKSVNLKK